MVEIVVVELIVLVGGISEGTVHVGICILAHGASLVEAILVCKIAHSMIRITETVISTHGASVIEAIHKSAVSHAKRAKANAGGDRWCR